MKKRKMNQISKDQQFDFSTKIHVVCYVMVFCFMFLPMRSLLSLTSIAYAESAAGTDLSSPESSRFDVTRTDDNAINNLHYSRISAVNDLNNEKGREKLKRLIEQVNAIELTVKEQAPEPNIVSTQEKIPRPRIVLPEPALTEDETEGKEEVKEKIRTETRDELLNNKTLELLGNMKQKPEQLENPFELGEVLFLSGYYKEAAVFYQEALRRIEINDINLAQERAWILFQIGNCLRNIDKPVATKMYGQLISEYPNSPWMELAQVQIGLIEWYRKEEPQELISASNL